MVTYIIDYAKSEDILNSVYNHNFNGYMDNFGMLIGVFKLL